MDKEVKLRLFRIFIFLIVIVITIVIAFNKDMTAVSTMGFDTGNEVVRLVPLSKGINLDNAAPVSDELGSKNPGYKFKIINDSDSNKEFVIGFNNSLSNEDEMIPYRYFRYQILKNNKIFIKYNTLSDDGFLFKDNIVNDTVYEIKLWIDYMADNSIMGKHFSGEIVIK